MALQVDERIRSYDVEGDGESLQRDLSMIKQEDVNFGEEEGGGFMPDGNQNEIAQPTTGLFSSISVQEDEALAGAAGFDGGGFMADEDAEDALRDTEMINPTPFVEVTTPPVEHNERISTNRDYRDDDPESGGFIHESMSDAGGFLPDVDRQEGQEEDETMKWTRMAMSTLINPDFSVTEASPTQTALQQPNLEDDRNFVPTTTRDQHEPGPGPDLETESFTRLEPNATNERDKDDEEDTDDPAKEQEGQGEGEGENDKDDETERSSLLSHDPEDDDAEPEWLCQ